MRSANLQRKTKETEIAIQLTLDGSGKSEIATGIGFFDHMLTALALHAGMDLSIACRGDLDTDCHHTVEDVGIALGQALAAALADKSGLARYGTFTVPMDESLATCSLDIGGRAYLVFLAEFSNPAVGGLDCCMVKEFFWALAVNSKMTIHIQVPYGDNDHHKIEAIFKAFAHALQGAAAPQPGTLLSTKGVLEA